MQISDEHKHYIDNNISKLTEWDRLVYIRGKEYGEEYVNRLIEYVLNEKDIVSVYLDMNSLMEKGICFYDYDDSQSYTGEALVVNNITNNNGIMYVLGNIAEFENQYSWTFIVDMGNCELLSKCITGIDSDIFSLYTYITGDIGTKHINEIAKEYCKYIDITYDEKLLNNIINERKVIERNSLYAKPIVDYGGVMYVIELLQRKYITCEDAIATEKLANINNSISFFKEQYDEYIARMIDNENKNKIKPSKLKRLLSIFNNKQDEVIDGFIVVLQCSLMGKGYKTRVLDSLIEVAGLERVVIDIRDVTRYCQLREYLINHCDNYKKALIITNTSDMSIFTDFEISEAEDVLSRFKLVVLVNLMSPENIDCCDIIKDIDSYVDNDINNIDMFHICMDYCNKNNITYDYYDLLDMVNKYMNDLDDLFDDIDYLKYIGITSDNIEGLEVMKGLSK